MKKVKCLGIAITILAIALAICGCANDSEEENAPSVSLSKQNASKILGANYMAKEEIEIPANVTSINSGVFSTIKYNGFYYEVEPNKVLKKITFQKGSSLKEINTSAFSTCSALESIELPESLEKISDGAFGDCSKLKELKIPKNVTYIGKAAFTHCSNLEELEISENVSYIGEQAFLLCNGLKKIILPANIGNANIGPSAFDSCFGIISRISTVDEIIYKGTIEDWCKIPWFEHAIWNVNKIYFGDSDTPALSLEIPSTVTSISPAAFQGYIGLKSVTFSDTDINIGESAFDMCENLSSIKFGNSNTLIESAAFSSCVNLSNIDFGNGSIQIGSGAFYKCKKLESIHIQNGTIEQDAFEYCENLKDVKLGGGITFISASAFRYCNNLESATFENKQNWYKVYDDIDGNKIMDPIATSSLEDKTIAARILLNFYGYYFLNVSN